MKKPRLPRRASRLFAVLMRDEMNSRLFIGLLDDSGYTDAQQEYLAFLRSQSKHADANCPSRRAVALIEGRA